MATKTSDVRPARERLLDAANDLFYEEGVHTVGIDRVIERAGVAKATLYSTFGSKDGLIREYLHARDLARRKRIMVALEGYTTAREQLLGVFDVLGDSFADPGFHGCAFLNASAEAQPGSSIIAATDEYRGWIRALFADLGRRAGASDPDALARALHLLYDGAGVSARMDRDLGAATAAREVAAVLVDAAVTG